MDDRVPAELAYLLRRPEKKARQRRVLDALNDLCPDWERLARDDRFLTLLREASPTTGATWGNALVGMSDEFDGTNLATLFHLLQGKMLGRRPRLGTKLGDGRHVVGELVAKHYEVIDQLGAGGFGEVLLVYSHEAEMREFRAMKVMRAGRALDQSTFARFKKEAHLLMGLRPHPRLVHTPTVELLDDGAIAIFSEFVVPDALGRVTLADHVGSGELTPDVQSRLLIECCHGLQAAFEDGVLAHRDLKPANILVGSRVHARVADFGLARLDTGSGEDFVGRGPGEQSPPTLLQTGLGHSFGTPPYMAPEQFVDASNCDQRSDVYSLGIVLYELASRGQLPFVASAKAGWQDWATLHHLAPVPVLDHPLFPVILRCIAKSPDRRFQTTGELAAALADLRASRNWSPVLTEARDEFAIDSLRSRMNRAIGFHRLGNHRRAIAMFEECANRFDLCASDAYAYQLLCHKALREYDAAIACGLKVTDSRRSADTETALGYCFAITKRWADAVRHYARAVALDPTSLNAWENLARGYLVLGRRQDAKSAIETCTALPDAGATQWALRAEIEASANEREPQ
jgi:eukaryotic-like serine/threonine-protein kinase